MYDRLRRDGYVTLPVIGPSDFERVQRRFEEALDSMPEFFVHDEELDGQRDRRTEQWVVGQFGRLGNASSVHAPFVRRLRKWAHEAATRQLFNCEQCGHEPPRYLTQLPDGVLVRPTTHSNVSAQWHRDETPCARRGDEIFGGWLNLNLVPAESQWFVCVPRSHDPRSAEEGRGFYRITDKRELERCKRKKLKVEVPAGHMLVFYQNIAHTVYGGSRTDAATPLYRLFTAWLLATRPEPLPFLAKDKLDTILAEQALFPLKSGQMPPMYAKTHASYHGHLIDEFTEDRIVHVCRDERTDRVHRNMHSLKHYGLQRYRPYRPHERAILEPAPLQ